MMMTTIKMTRLIALHEPPLHGIGEHRPVVHAVEVVLVPQADVIRPVYLVQNNGRSKRERLPGLVNLIGAKRSRDKKYHVVM